MRARISALLAPGLLMMSGLPALAEPEMVLLVRHAERAAEPRSDPELTPEGQARAQALARALEQAGVTAIITTQFRRTQDTAAPLAAARGLKPEIVEAKRGEDHVAAVAAAVRRLGGVVLVVGHSNTVPAIAAALSGTPKGADFCETSYSHLWVLQGQRLQHLARARYGAADAVAPQGACQ